MPASRHCRLRISAWLVKSSRINCWNKIFLSRHTLCLMVAARPRYFIKQLYILIVF